jgi:hypothetical protein
LKPGDLRVVALESRGVEVPFAALELDHEPLLGPVRVDVVARDSDVCLVRRKPGRLDQVVETPLELFPRRGCASRVVGKQRLEGLQARMTLAAVGDFQEGGVVQELSALHRFIRPPHLLARLDRGQVEQRPREGGYGDAVDHSHVLRLQVPRTVDADPGPVLTPATGPGYIHRLTAVIADFPQGGRVAMAEKRAWAKRQDRGQPASFPCRPARPDEVDAVVKACQSPLDHAQVNTR